VRVLAEVGCGRLSWDVPESRERYDVIVRFFDHHLTR
jgi:hypothetical protein